MRISDWSSDVCSSDLIATRLPCFTDADCVIPAPFSRESRWFITAGAAWPGSRRLNMRSFVLAGLMAATAMPAVAYADSPSRAEARHDRREKIGRASCRERVCQYV